MEIGRGGAVSRSNNGGRLGSIPAGERCASCQQGPPGDGRGTRKAGEMAGQEAREGVQWAGEGCRRQVRGCRGQVRGKGASEGVQGAGEGAEGR